MLRAPDRYDRDRAPALVEDRRRHAVERLLELADADAVAVAAYRRELLLEPAPLRDRRVGEALEPRRHERLALVLRKPGEERLPGRRRVQREGAAEPVRRHDLRRLDLMHVDEVEALRDREVHGLARLVCELLEHRMCAPHERVVVTGRRDLEDRVADAVALRRRVALDEALAVERREQAPRGAAVEPALRGELDDRQRLLAVCDRFQKRRGAVDGLDRAEARGGLDVGHRCSMVPAWTSRASRPSAPRGVTSRGLISSSPSHGARAARCESAEAARAAAAMSKPPRSGAVRSVRRSRSASSGSTGASATATSRSVSVWMPPSPTSSSGPKLGSRRTPTMSSMPPSSDAICSTEPCPSNTAASSSSSAIPSTTPPASDLCSCASDLSTTG